MNNQKGFATILLIVALVIVVLAGGIGYWAWTQKSSAPTSSTTEVPTQQNTNTTNQQPQTQTPTNTTALDCVMLTDNRSGVLPVATGQEVMLYWGSKDAQSYEIKGSPAVTVLRNETYNGAGKVSFSTPGTYTYSVVMHGANSSVAICSTTITVTYASTQAPTTITPITALVVTGNVITLRVGEAVQDSQGRLIHLVSAANGVADIKVTSRDGAATGTQELVLKQGQEGLFLNFYPVGFHITPTSITNGSATLSVELQPTD